VTSAHPDTAALGALTSISLWTSAEAYPVMRAFYIETLGLRPETDRPGRVRFTFGASPHEVRLILSVHDGVTGDSAEPDRVMFNFLVRDIQATVVRLTAAGVEFRRLPGQEEWGGWVATFADPDGNALQLFQPGAEPA
jgi:catechol 2,3-dioxygenase-like lactoylglutathione lyase family enzyme